MYSIKVLVYLLLAHYFCLWTKWWWKSELLISWCKVSRENWGKPSRCSLYPECCRCWCTDFIIGNLLYPLTWMIWLIFTFEVENLLHVPILTVIWCRYSNYTFFSNSTIFSLWIYYCIIIFLECFFIQLEKSYKFLYICCKVTFKKHINAAKKINRTCSLFIIMICLICFL